jgi:hypothetical protein
VIGFDVSPTVWLLKKFNPFTLVVPRYIPLTISGVHAIVVDVIYTGAVLVLFTRTSSPLELLKEMFGSSEMLLQRGSAVAVGVKVELGSTVKVGVNVRDGV